MARALAPKPHRGDVVAAGVVVLATLAVVLDGRFAGAWPAGVRLAVAAAACGLVTALAVLSPRPPGAPRAYESVLCLASLALGLLALARLAEALGSAGLDAPGTRAWVGAVLAAGAWAYAVGRGSAVCTLAGAVAAAAAALGLVGWAFAPDGPAAVRWTLAGVIVALALTAVTQRDRRPRQAVALVNAAGLAATALALSFLVVGVVDLLSGSGPEAVDVGAGAGWGWELFLLAVAFGLIAFSGVDRHPGPGYLGVLVLWLTATLVARPDGGEATLLGWPLVLAAAAGALLAVGLRPSHPLPPEPQRPPTEVLPFEEPVRGGDRR